MNTHKILQNNIEWVLKRGFIGNTTCVGFLVKLKQNIEDYFIKNKDIKVIFLRRNNRLATLLSYKIAHKLGCYEEKGLTLKQATGRRNSAKPIYISTKEAERFFDYWSSKELSILSKLKNSGNYMEIVYEDLYKKPNKIMTELYKFLGVRINNYNRSNKLQRGSEKLDKRLLKNAISNYGELKKHFNQTNYKEYFNEMV